MAQDHWSPRTDVVDVSATVDVGDVRAARGLDEARRAADAAKRAHRRVHAAGYEFHRLRKQFLRSHGRENNKPSTDYTDSAQSVDGLLQSLDTFFGFDGD